MLLKKNYNSIIGEQNSHIRHRKRPAPTRRRKIAQCDVFPRMGADPAAKVHPMRCFSSHGRRPVGEGSPDAMYFIAWAPARRRRCA